MTNPDNDLEDVKSQPEAQSPKPAWQAPSLITMELGTDTASGCLIGSESCAGFLAS